MVKISRLDELGSSWGQSPYLLNAASDLFWSEADRKEFFRRIARTVSDQWLRVLLNGRYVFHKELLQEAPLSVRDGTLIVSADKLESYLNQSATIVVRGAHSYLSEAHQFSEVLEAKFKCPISCNLYAAKCNSVGFKEHFDTHHIIVVQLHGSKTWRVSPTVEQQSSKFVSISKQVVPPGTPRLVFTLQSGDGLYLPRGCWHCASSGPEGSTHLSFGIHIPTKGEQLLNEARLSAATPYYSADLYGFP